MVWVWVIGTPVFSTSPIQEGVRDVGITNYEVIATYSKDPIFKCEGVFSMSEGSPFKTGQAV